MSSYYWAFWYAVVFLSRLPAPTLQRIDDDVAQKSLLFYPLIGALLGTLLLMFVACCWWYQPQPSATLLAAMSVTLWTLLTGALHLDGLADSADAWVGGLGDREKTLAIMKDPQAGPIGVVAVVLLLLLQFSALQLLFEQTLGDGDIWPLLSLLLIPALARASVLGILASTPYVRAKGLATALVQGARYPRITVIGIILALTAGLILQQKALLVLLSYLALNVWMRRLMMQRLGGCTGDTLGAAIAVQEVLLLCVYVF